MFANESLFNESDETFCDSTLVDFRKIWVREEVRLLRFDSKAKKKWFMCKRFGKITKFNFNLFYYNLITSNSWHGHR